MELTRTHRILIGLVIGGAVIIAGIGFAGSYAAVRELAVHKGFGTFSYFFPIGIDAGICVLLALDLLLTWLRIPFPLLRQTAWILTAATIAFNGAAAWPDPLGVGMHAVIPVLFVVAVEAARHAVGRIADITADKHMEGVRLTRWLLSPVPTFRLWRRMKLWELRSYDQVIKLEQERLIYQARLQARFGRGWRRKAPVEALMPLRLARYGVPLAETAPAGLAAAGVDPVLLPPNPTPTQAPTQAPALAQAPAPVLAQAPVAIAPQVPQVQAQVQAQEQEPAPAPQAQAPGPQQQAQPNHESPWFDAQQVTPDGYGGMYTAQPEENPSEESAAEENAAAAIPGDARPVEPEQSGPELFGELQRPDPRQEPDPQMEEFREIAYKVTYGFVQEYRRFPTPFELDQLVAEAYGLQKLPEPQSDLLQLVTPEVQERVREEMQEYDPS
ncbi:DUF2637 domain-containing protein [Streptomyces sp. R302]|uniref:DUF2637 domain-containing protein n=1 Tax=unclassified Streptomyces TaxID=2593676 RepID=UPI00145D93F0|nr:MULTISPECIES: DUF2637 domain-containing protein [unclassified Streptomyces]NML54945.1 DUF2637 domain-containing protein [Streptomyces sp. R301]NML83632.1 DUF2637 domain-containing protein [Streptomyces sp. R302]